MRENPSFREAFYFAIGVQTDVDMVAYALALDIDVGGCL